ncbi:MAG: prephenate dehydrogenase [Treponema sp.]|jgi:prephenate dehydrogenase|nr:prephenate dehydrogenase [Treponema sp.]
MKKIEDCNFGFVGLGLMGGALSIALNQEKIVGEGHQIFAYDIDASVLRLAEESGVIDKGFTQPVEMLKQCDVVFICLNPGAEIQFMETHMRNFLPGTLLTDISGVKQKAAERIDAILRDDLDFIPGHPMAGREKGGFAEAGKVNFHGKNYILTPLERNRSENLAFMRELITRIGFTQITETTLLDHDKKIAFTSQLCHVIASALIDCEADSKITRFGGGSFEDLTRIAMLNAPMWTELFIDNRDELINCINRFESSLDKLKLMIDHGTKDELIETLSAVRARRIEMTASE